MPAADTVRVIVAAIGLALTVVSVRASSSSTHENMKQKKSGNADAASNQWKENAQKEAWKRVTIKECGLVDLTRYPRHKSFEDPNREGDVEETMRQRHRPRCVEQTYGRIEVEERECEHRRWRHAVGEQPEEEVLVAEEPIARKRVSRRKRQAYRNHGVDENVAQRIDVTRIPARVRKDLNIVGKRRAVRPYGQARDDLGIRFQAHVDEPVDRQQQKSEEPSEDHTAAGYQGHDEPPST